MSILLIFSVLAIVAYLVHGVVRGPARGKPRDSVAEFNRALSALDPRERPSARTATGRRSGRRAERSRARDSRNRRMAA